jgi:AbiV family abortive infection protein
MERNSGRATALSRDEIEALAHAAHANASALAEEATILLEAGRLARAYALAETAAEELGKVVLLARVGGVTTGSQRPQMSRRDRAGADAPGPGPA